VLNHTIQVDTFTRDKISDSLKKKILAEVPYDGRNMIKAINQGTPYLTIAPKSSTSLEILKLAYRISATEMMDKHTNRDEESVQNLQKLVFGS
jgi:MinD-like ATPase involved in chromosome partitioning or flagellar assembly